MTQLTRRRPGSASVGDIYGALGGAGSPVAPDASAAAGPPQRARTWQVAMVPEGNVTPVPFTIDALAASLIVVNPTKAPLYIAFRDAPAPTWADKDIICPARSLMTIPVLRADRDRTTSAIVGSGSPVGSSTDNGDPLVATGNEALIFASEAALPAAISGMALNAGEIATEKTLADLLALQQGGSGVPYDTIASSAATVGILEYLVPLAIISGTKAIMIQNRGPASVYWGASGVTTATGQELVAGATITLPIGESTVALIAAAAGNDVRVTQFIITP